MKSNKQRSDAALSAVLAHTTYASIPTDADTDTKIKELLKGLRILSEEYGVDFEKDSLIDKTTLVNVVEDDDCWRCKNCGAEWSFAAGDNEVPEICTYC